MLGISSYFKDLDYEYLEKARACGAHYLFTSLHIPEEDYTQLDAIMPEFLEKVKLYQLELVPDISPETFTKLKISSILELKQFGFSSLRLDYGFDAVDTVKELIKEFDLILNASTLNEQQIQAMIEADIDLTRIKVMHNFYPKTDTGLALDFFDSLNRVFLKYDIPIMAFVPGDFMKRFPLYEGLPTVEAHRQKHPYVAAVELVKNHDVSDILIGDSKARISTLKYINAYLESKILHIPAHLTQSYKDLYNTNLNVRRDLSERVVRVQSPRISDIPVSSNNYRNKGSITIDNQCAGRYSGEIQLIKQDMNMSPRANVIGFIHPDYCELLDYIDQDTQIKFVMLTDED